MRGTWKGEVVWPGVLSFAGVRQEIKTRCVRQVKTEKIKCVVGRLSADIRQEMNTRGLDG